MKGLLMGILDIVVLLSLLTFGASAPPAEAASGVTGPYEGTFRGAAYGDKGSSARLELELLHRGSNVTGTVSIGDGLHVDGGLCGAVDIPALSQSIAGETLGTDAHRMEANPVFEVGGLDLKVDFESNVSLTGNVISARVKIDLPWFCGRDPMLTARLYRN
jgi:hypothetical protein